MTQHNTRALVESALLAVVGTILVLIGQYVPLIGIIATFLWPLPSALVVLRHGMRWGIMSSIVTALTLGFFMDWITALGLWVLFGLTGLTFGYAVSKQYAPVAIILLTSVAFIVGLLVSLLSVYLVAGLTPMGLLEEQIRIFQKAAEYNETLLGPNQFLEIFKDFDLMKEQFIRLLPAVILVWALSQSYLNFEVLRRVLTRLGHDLQALPPFSRWILPEYVAYGAMLSYLAAAFGAYYQIAVLEKIGQNIWYVISLLLFLEAASVVSYYFLRARVPRIFIGLILFFLFTTPIFNMLAVLFGIIDILFDFRRLRYGWLDEF